jgi:preprotein translocase subunit YajC
MSPTIHAALLALLQAPAAPQADPNALPRTIFTFGSIFAIIWFVMLRPQQKQRKQHEEMLKQIKKGDEVVTAGGIVGRVVHLPDDERVVITSENTRLLVERARIARVVTAAGATSAAPAGPEA